MGRITFLPTFNYIDDAKKLADLLSGFLGQLTSEFNGQLDFGANIRASGISQVSFLNSSDVMSVNHTLRVIPNGILLIRQNAAGSVYAPVGAQYGWTSKHIFLQASAAMSVSLYVI